MEEGRAEGEPRVDSDIILFYNMTSLKILIFYSRKHSFIADKYCKQIRRVYFQKYFFNFAKTSNFVHI